MRSIFVPAFLVSALGLAGCQTMTSTQIANVSCMGAEAGADVAVAVTTDANTGANATKAAAHAQQTAGAIQRAVSDVCPTIVASVKAINAAAAAGGSAN